MTARSLLAGGTLALAVAAPAAFLPDPRPLAAALALWVGLTASGLLVFYVPAWRRTRRGAGAHAAADAAAAAAVLLAGVAFVASALLPLFLGRAALALLPVAPVLPLVVAGALYVLPRQAKRPFPAPAAWALAVAAVVAGAAVPPWAPAVALPALVVLVAGLAWLVALPARATGAQAKAAWPLFAAGAAAVGATPLLMALGKDQRPALGALLLVGEALFLAALTYALAPVVANQVPRDRRWTRALAPVALAGGLLVAAGLRGAPTLLAGKVLLAAVALAHVANLAPMRRPRRECPPDLVAP